MIEEEGVDPACPFCSRGHSTLQKVGPSSLFQVVSPY